MSCRMPSSYRFQDDGRTPNNPRWPLLHYRNVLDDRRGRDAAAFFEKLFAAHDWTGAWRNGIHDFLHFHTLTHEVLGIAGGSATVQFGGDAGCTLTVTAGDVVVLPAGTGHRRIQASSDLLVVGAYPSSRPFDQCRPADIDHAEAMERIRRVPRPAQDPVHGAHRPLLELWPQ